MEMKSKAKIAVAAEFTLEEFDALVILSSKKDLSFNGILRQALRLYQMADVKQSEGQRMIWVDKDGSPVPELSMLLPNEN